MKKMKIQGKQLDKTEQKKIAGGKPAPLCGGNWAPCDNVLLVCCSGLICTPYGGDAYCRFGGEEPL